MKAFRFATISILLAASAGAASATTVLNNSLANLNGSFGAGVATTSPLAGPQYGTLTTVNGPGAGANRASASYVADQWVQRNVGGNASVGITTHFARSGNGSAYYSSNGSNAKADLEIAFSSPALLSAVTGLRYDWYKTGSSTASQHLALKLLVDADGNTNTFNDISYLIYELGYNTGDPGAVDAWNQVLIDADTFLWANNLSVLTDPKAGTPYGYDTTLSDWQGANQNARVLGLSVGLGSGWVGSYEGGVDNIVLAVGETRSNWNFEVQLENTVPEPGTLGLIALGLLGTAALRRRKA
ncbi:MAG: hypothetical protein C0423_03995 [Methylibium sp.]|nr:hypothetical protein [Methylibium sp.]